jgi:hypothetical protein
VFAAQIVVSSIYLLLPRAQQIFGKERIWLTPLLAGCCLFLAYSTLDFTPLAFVRQVLGSEGPIYWRALGRVLAGRWFWWLLPPLFGSLGVYLFRRAFEISTNQGMTRLWLLVGIGAGMMMYSVLLL